MLYFGGFKYDVIIFIKYFYGRIINFNCYNYIKIFNIFYIFDNCCFLVSRLFFLYVFLFFIILLICYYYCVKISSR